ncbi:MAG TPA: Gfo/Idh/MocA family oxidoreductase [Casimicrobiaceae bacterium]|jgi:predicted dehydrogenase
MMKTIRWGMIGCGDVAEVKSGPGFYKAEHSQLVAVMRGNGALAADFARLHGVPRSYDNADAIIHATAIDAVYIATLTDSHCEYTLRCAAAGKPVYVEKPMAMNHVQCAEMIAAYRPEDIVAASYRFASASTAAAHGASRPISTRSTTRSSARADASAFRRMRRFRSA